MEDIKGIGVAPKSIIEKIKILYNIELIEISYADLPLEVREHIESRSRKFAESNFIAKNFSKLYKFIHPNGDITYIAQQDKKYETNGSTERLTYFVDMRGTEITGHIEIRLGLTDISQYFKDKPFVGYTETKEGYLKQGLAIRRLREANAYSLAEHDFPLNSDSLISDEAKGVWEKLILEGEAEKYDEDGKTRYRFTKTTF